MQHSSAKILSGKIAVVTGASRGLGRAAALRLAQDGALVVVHFNRDRERANAVVDAIRGSGGQALAIQAELGSLPAITRFYEQLDVGLRELTDLRALDILVNNAGVVESMDFEATDEAAFDRLFDVNVKGTFFMTQGALPRMRSGGRIINISSVASRTHFPEIAAYASSKGAVNTLTIHWAAALGPRGITVNAVSPGVIDTDMSTWVRTSSGEAIALGMQALARIGQPNDIADVVAFLASPDSRWVTGAYLEVSGGMRL
jgi:3-oxoacyl-[acyl-carrier protein] reductase